MADGSSFVSSSAFFGKIPLNWSGNRIGSLKKIFKIINVLC